MVAGFEKSSREEMNTSRQAEMMPGRESGNVTLQKVFHLPAPMLQAASSTEASMEERMPESVRYAIGKNDMHWTTIRAGAP